MGTSYEYLESYASKMGQPVEKAVFSLLGEIKGVLGVIFREAASFLSPL